MKTNSTTLCRLAAARVRLAAVLAAVSLLWAAPAAAQIAPFGVNPLLLSTGVRGSDVAYDPVNNVYLVVGAYGTVWGAFTDTAGNKISSFAINTTGSFAHFPRVSYSPNLPNGSGGVGAFLVTWHENSGVPNYVNTRVVSYPAGPVSAQQTIVSPFGTWWEVGPSVAYSQTSGVFLVVWRAGTDYSVWGARLNSNGTLIGSPFQISPAGVGAQNPSLTWNAASNTFAVMYTGWGAAGTTTTVSVVSVAGGVVATNAFNQAGAAGTYLTGIAYNSATGRSVGVWYQSGAGTLGAEVASDGSILATGPVSTQTGAYDGLGISYNPVSGTFLLVGHGQSYNIWAAELNNRGARTSGDREVSFAGGPTGSFYPLVGASTRAPQWELSFAHNFNELRDQVVTTSSSGGGPAGSLGSAPAPTGGGGGTSTGGCPGTAPFPGAVCVNGGWVPGSGGTSGGTSTGGCPGTAPFPGAVCVNGGWVAGSGGTSTGGTSTGGCPGTAPFPGAVCVNGGWVPGSGTTSGGTTTTGGCPGTAPFPGAVCVNGGWVPGSGGTSTGGCPGTAPFPGAVCVNGGWVAGTTTSTSGCPGTAPFPGAVCVNGGWVPGTGGTSTGGCPGTAPFPGAVCVNGGWVPGSGGTSTGSCPGTAPFPGAVCVNGGWVPGTTTSSCPGTAPFAGAICVNGGWVPGTTLTSTSSCTTPDPFTAIGGGVCINGGWIPKME